MFDLLFIAQIVWLHGLPIFIFFDKGMYSLFAFWRALYYRWDTWLDITTICHPKMKAPPEQMIQVLEDTLRMCVIYFGSR